MPVIALIAVSVAAYAWVNDKLGVLGSCVMYGAFAYTYGADESRRIRYNAVSDTLTVTEWHGGQWHQAEHNLRNAVGICVVRHTGYGMQIQWIDRRQQAHELLTGRYGLIDSLAQKISLHTGLPLLQDNQAA